MRGTLHKTESGWQVWYHAKDDLYHGSIRVRILPLHPDEPILVDKRWDGTEVEFEIFDNRQICNCVCHRDPNITHFVACCNDGYKTDNLGHVNYYAKLVDEWPHYQTRADQLREQVWEEIIREFYREAQQVEKGRPPLIFEIWLTENYNPPTKKQE
jgi:hypothetical protein